MSTNDTLFGGALSPDGKLVAIGGADNSVRVIEVETGKEMFKAGYHEDWVLDSVFDVDGKRIVTVGRDRAAKLADAVSGAFIENVNFLREQLFAIARHPRRDHVLIGGSDRVPYLYMMDRPRALKIADDSTLVRKFDELPGPIHALAFNADGSRKQRLCGSDGDHRGAPAIWVATTADGLGAYAVDEAGGLYTMRADGTTAYTMLPDAPPWGRHPTLMGPLTVTEEGLVYVGGFRAIYALDIEDAHEPVKWSFRINQTTS